MKTLLILATFLIILVAGCVSMVVTPIPTTGNLLMKITDAPGNITSLNITISQIEVHKAEPEETNDTNVTPTSCEEQCQELGHGTGTCREGNVTGNETLCLGDELDLNDSTFCTPTQNDTVTTCCCDTNTTAPEEQYGWIVFSSEEKTFDLIAIRDVQEILGNETLDTGKYTQIRLLVKSAVLVIDDEEKDIKVPSGKLKLIHPFYIVANQTTTLLLDFDAEKSVVERGKTGKYNLKPTIRVTTV